MSEHICPHCKSDAGDEVSLSVFHRGCRFKAAFGEDTYESKDGLLSFDLKKIEEKIKAKEGGR